MKKFFIGLIGGTVLLFGAAMLVLPGPGLPVVAAGLAILASEFLWARRAWHKARCAVARTRRKTGLCGWLGRIGARGKVSRSRPRLGGGKSAS
jgi:hypothetical protein